MFLNCKGGTIIYELTKITMMIKPTMLERDESVNLSGFEKNRFTEVKSENNSFHFKYRFLPICRLR